MAVDVVVPSHALDFSREVLAELFGPISTRAFAIRFWNGEEDLPDFGDHASDTRFTLVLCHPGALRRMFLPPSELRMGEVYLAGDFEIEGDIEAAAALADEVHERFTTAAAAFRLFRLLSKLPRTSVAADTPRRMRHAFAKRHTPGRDAVAVRSHYDVGNDFYQLWLDRRMVYSCAYFERPDADLDAAQTAKLEHICRKLRLRPGDRLLDVGCGWGGLIRYAAAQHGVTAMGITLSEAQASLARERIRVDGLSERCRVEVCDYRDLRVAQPFDKIASVGMIEHVGRRQLPGYFAALHALVKPGGLVLNHGIVDHRLSAMRSERHSVQRRLWHEGVFIDRYVFPDGELMPLADVIEHAESAGFEARDVESLREHYRATLQRWVKRLEAARATAVALVGERVFRTWRLYMGAAAHGFAVGRLNVIQTLLARPDAKGHVALPRTRRDLYCPTPGGQ